MATTTNGITVLSLRDRAQAMGENVGGYSADRYRSWASVAYHLLKMGLDEREAEAVMRSKWTRWAADADDKHRYGYHPGHIIVDYLWDGDTTPEDVAQEIGELVEGTFGTTYTREEAADLVARIRSNRPRGKR